MRPLSLLYFFLLAQQRDLINAARSTRALRFDRLFCPNPLPNPDWIFGDPRQNKLYYDVMIRRLDFPPPQWSSRNFTSLVDLCSYFGNRNVNMGGWVSSSHHSNQDVYAAYPYIVRPLCK